MWGKSGKRRGKYGAIRTQTIDGLCFPSKLERSVYDILKRREEAGEIGDILCQSTVYLSRSEIKYIADFKFWDKTNHEFSFAEAKGMQTPSWRIKRRLWKSYGPGKLYIYTGSYKSPILSEVIDPKKNPDRCPECGQLVDE